MIEQTFNTRTILKKLGNKNLDLVSGGGQYYFFMFDDGVTFRTRSVMVKSLRHWSLKFWLAAGERFLDDCLNQKGYEND